MQKSTKMKISNPATTVKEPKRFDNIIKSPNDKRFYRGLILENEMKVLLISDPTTDKSAASLDVAVGYLSDPKEIPGLAHFCEHMLFLGTKKYPSENEYSLFLSQHGGGSNAWTLLDNTNHYFDIDPEHLEGALERFSQFFLSPLFTESSTEKELNAVNSEHEKNLSNDTWRVDQLDKSCANPAHPYSKFGTGNKETLDIIPKQKNIKVREELLKFHENWYSSNIMSLSILGKESLDDLEKMVLSMFSDVKNKHVEAPVWPEHPYTEEHFKMKYYVVPIKDVRCLNIIFPIPDTHEHFRSAPVNYVAHLLGHESEGSLLSLLRNKGWCNTLVAGQRMAARGFDFMTLYVDLTEEGILHIDEIITFIFQYINMLKQEPPVEWIFNEYRDIAAMNFRFSEKTAPKSEVVATAQNLQKFPFEEVLSAPALFTEWRPDLIQQILDCLVPSKCRVQIVAKIFEEDATSVEPWYGTKYKKEKIPDSVIKSWENAGLNPELQLPKKNVFIPTKFEIKKSASIDKFPVIISDTPLTRVWFKQDDEFLLPKVNMTFDFVSPYSYVDPLSCNMMHMFVLLFRDSLNEYAYDASLAGLKWVLTNSKYGLRLAIDGYDDKQNVLLTKIMDRMLNFKIDPKRFEILKESYIRGLKNFAANQPHQHSSYYMAVLLSEQFWVKSELLETSDSLSVENLQQFIPQFLSRLHTECLIYGNVTKNEALNLVQIVEKKLTSSIKDLMPLLPKHLILYREIELARGSHFLFEIENAMHKSSCTQVYYQSGMTSLESNVLLELLTQIISEPCYNVLRTQEQLGYIVFSGVRRSNGIQGLIVIVQSSKHPKYVEKRIDLFVESMLDHITKMSDDEFSRYKESLATLRLEKPKKMGSQFVIYWNEILSQQYHFDRTEVEVAYLRTVTKDQIIKYFKEIVHSSSSSRQKLSVHVVSTAEGGAGVTEQEESKESCESATDESVVEGPIEIHDILQFKTSQSLYPLVKPYNNIPRRGMPQQSKL